MEYIQDGYFKGFPVCTYVESVMVYKYRWNFENILYGVYEKEIWMKEIVVKILTNRYKETHQDKTEIKIKKTFINSQNMHCICVKYMLKECYTMHYCRQSISPSFSITLWVILVFKSVTARILLS